MKVLHGRSMVAALIAAAVVVTVFVVTRDRRAAVGSNEPEMAEATSQRHLAVPLPAARSSSDREPVLAGSDADQPDDYEDHPLADVMRKVLANDSQLNTFMYYYNRPLLSEADKKLYHAQLSDPAVLASVEHDLLYPEEAKADRASSIKRLMKIDYLHEALEWKDNPRRAEVIALLKKLLLTDNYPPDMTMDMRLSLSGNKMEMYELLNDIAPDEATAVVAASRGTRLERLIAYIANTIAVRKQIEASAESQVAPKAQ